MKENMSKVVGGGVQNLDLNLVLVSLTHLKGGKIA